MPFTRTPSVNSLPTATAHFVGLVPLVSQLAPATSIEKFTADVPAWASGAVPWLQANTSAPGSRSVSANIRRNLVSLANQNFLFIFRPPSAGLVESKRPSVHANRIGRLLMHDFMRSYVR